MKSLVLILFLSLPLQSALSEEVWKITSLDWQPYSGQELQNQGNSIEKLRKVLKQHGVKLIVEFYPWNRARLLAKNKEYIGYFPAWPEEVEPGFVTSVPIDMSNIGLIKLAKKKIEHSSTDELFKNYRYGIVESYVYPDKFMVYINKNLNNKVPATNEVSLFNMLQAERFDFAITDPKVIQYIENKPKNSNLSVIKVCMQRALVMAIRSDEKNQEQVKKIQSILTTLKN